MMQQGCIILKFQNNYRIDARVERIAELSNQIFSPATKTVPL